MSTFSPDLFGDRAATYARLRPGYPEALFDHLAALSKGRQLAWDCGTGSAQAAVALARRFARVVATDLSRRQLAHAPRVAGIDYAACLAETSPLRQGCADAVIVSAALHWFDRPRFYAEVRRVARPGALLAVWSYYHSRVSPEVDPVLDRFADHDIAPWWGPGMAMNRTRYRDLDLPFERLPWPAFEAEARMTLEELLDYVRTWSATQACARATGTDPVETIRPELGAAWGDPGVARTVRWPLHGGIARLPD